MSWFNIIKQLTPMQSRLKDIARREGIEKFGDRTMIIRINRKMGDDFELTLRSKIAGEDRRSVYEFKFRDGKLYMAQGPHLMYTSKMGEQGDGEEELYRAFKQSINIAARDFKEEREKMLRDSRKTFSPKKRPEDVYREQQWMKRMGIIKSWVDIIKRTGKSKGTGLRGRGYKSPKDSTSRRKEDEKEILEPELEELQ